MLKNVKEEKKRCHTVEKTNAISINLTKGSFYILLFLEKKMEKKEKKFLIFEMDVGNWSKSTFLQHKQFLPIE